MDNIDVVENEKRMLRGELYYAFLPGLTAKRNRCKSHLRASTSFFF